MSECIVRFQKRWVDEIKRIGCAGCPIKFQSCILKEHDKEPCPILCVLPESHGRLVDADANFLGVIHMNGGVFANYNTTIAERIGEEDMRMVKVIVPAERSET